MNYFAIPHSSVLCNNELRDTDLVFNKIMIFIRQEFGDSAFSNLFLGVSVKSFVDGTMVLNAPSKFIRDWIIANYLTKINEIAVQNFKELRRVEIVFQAIEKNDKTEELQGNKLRYKSNEDSISMRPGASFNERFTFDNFVVGNNNKMAYIAAQNIAGIASVLNHETFVCHTLFIHGAVGMGKTHLLQAIASHIRKASPQKAVSYLSAERFMYLYMMAVKKNELINFKESLRSLDILLFDDLQFICDKNSTQREFANTVNALIESDKKIVVACDRSPYNLDLDHRTKSRISSGVVADIGGADFELRMKILNKKLSSDAYINEDILKYLATNITSNVRELEGSLNRLLTYCNLNEMPVTLEICKSTLKDCIKAHEQELSIEKIIQITADSNGVTKSEILSKSRLAKLVYLRQMIAYIAKDITSYSLQEIGKQLGGKDHATIIYYIKQFQYKIKRKPSLIDEVNNVIEIVKNNR